MRLRVAPISLREANEFVARLHRHHGPVAGHKFSISVIDEVGQVRGVAITGRPVARLLDDGTRLEVLRVCADGTPNVCSMLYGAVRRIALAMGYEAHCVITYTLADESGASLRASGWCRAAVTSGGSWDRPSRARTDRHPLGEKVRWQAGPNPGAGRAASPDEARALPSIAGAA